MDNDTKFKEYFRLTPNLFKKILVVVEDDLSKQSSNRYPKPISPRQKLCISLRYLATGESLRSLSFQFRGSHQYLSVITKQTLTAVHEAIPEPTMDSLKEIESQEKWNYPNCVGAIDGKHVKIICPPKTGSAYFNYKEYFSIVQLAFVDANYKFIAIDVGAYGREGDSGVFNRSNFGQKIQNGSFYFPPPKKLPNSDVESLHVIVGDEAFTLLPNMMRSYPRKQALTNRTKAIYNYKHSRARRVVENAFGIILSYFRIFFTPINADVATTDLIVLSSCIFYNLLRNERINAPIETEFNTINLNRNEIPTLNLTNLTQNNQRKSAEVYSIRDKFKDYFNGEGAVEWQNTHVYFN